MSAFRGKADTDQPLLSNSIYEHTVAEDKLSNGVTKEECKAAMNALYAKRQIVTKTGGPPSGACPSQMLSWMRLPDVRYWR